METRHLSAENEENKIKETERPFGGEQFFSVELLRSLPEVLCFLREMMIL